MATLVGPEHYNGCEICYRGSDINSPYTAYIRWPDGMMPAAGASWLNTYTDDLSNAREITKTFIDLQLRDHAAFVQRFIATAK